MIRCANFNLPMYPKLDAYLKSQLGDGSINYTTVISFINDDMFKNIITVNNIGIEDQVNKAYESLVRVAAIRTNNPELLQKITDDSQNYGYLTNKARLEAIQQVRARLNNHLFVSLSQNQNLSINVLLDKVTNDFAMAVKNIMGNLINNPEAREDFEKNFETKENNNINAKAASVVKFLERFSKIRTKLEHEDIGKLAKLNNFISKYGTPAQYNLFKTYVNLSNPEFIKAVKLTGDYQKYERKEPRHGNRRNSCRRLELSWRRLSPTCSDKALF